MQGDPMNKLSFLLFFLLIFVFNGCGSTTTGNVTPSKNVVKVKKEYFTGGKIRSEFLMYDHTGMNGLRKMYGFEEKLISSAEIQNGVKHGKEIFYDEEGRIRLVRPYNNGRLDGVATAYYENSSPKMTITYVKGLKHGPAKKYNKNGSLFEQATFKNNKRVN